MPFDPNAPDATFDVVFTPPTTTTPSPNGVIADAPRQPNWEELYGSTDSFNSYPQLSGIDGISEQSLDLKKQAVNMAYLKNQMPGVPMSFIHDNWSTVKSTYAKQQGFGDGQEISDGELYAKIGEFIKQRKEDDQLVPANNTLMGRTRFMLSRVKPELERQYTDVFKKSLINLPEVKFPDIPSMGINNPAIFGTVYNLVREPINGATSPLGVASFGLFSELSLAAKTSPLAHRALISINGALAGLFGYSAAKGTYEKREMLMDPNRSVLEKAQEIAPEVGSAVISLLGALGTYFELKGPTSKAVVDEMAGKSPAAAAEIIRKDANTTLDPELEFAANAAADKLSEIHPAKVEQTVVARPNPQIEQIKSPAIKTKEGVIVEGSAHDGIPVEGERGFTATNDRFVGREEGMNIAKKADQTNITVEGKELHSHMLKQEEPALPTEIGEDGKPLPKPVSSPLIGIRNEVVDRELAEMGMPPSTHGEKMAFENAAQYAAQEFQKDPFVGDKLVNELFDAPRPVTANEDAVLLHELNRLRVDRDVAQQALIDAQKSGKPEAIVEANYKVVAAREAFAKASEVNTKVGTANAQGLAFRRMMMREDYSLASMENQLSSAYGGRKLTEPELGEVQKLHDKIVETEKAFDEHQKKLEKQRKPMTEEQRLAAAKRRLKKSTAEYKRRTEEGEFENPPRRHIILDEEGERLKTENIRAKQEFQKAVLKAQLEGRTPFEKFADTFVKWRRGFLLSSPVTLVKLTAAAAERGIITPAEEAIGAAIGKIPGISKVAERSPIQAGLNIEAEAKAFSDAFTKGMRDSATVLSRGRSDIEVLYEGLKKGKITEADIIDPSAIDMFGKMHQALKAPVKRAAFARAMEKQAAFYLKSGADISDPMLQTKMTVAAYKEAQAAIFMQDSAVSDAFNRAIARFEEVDKKTKLPSIQGKTTSAALRALFPIIKVPTNIVAETAAYTPYGLVRGIGRFAMAMMDDISKLPPEQADLIMRDLKKGSLGSALMMLGYFNPNAVGGYYQPGEKRKKGEAKVGSLRIYGMDVPSTLLHNPLLETMQIGATIRRVADSKLRRSDRDERGLATGAWVAALGLAEEIPLVRETTEIAKILDPRQTSRATGEVLKSIMVPALLQWTAQQIDRDKYGEKVKREPKSIIETIETGIPGIRERVRRKPGTSYRQ